MNLRISTILPLGLFAAMGVALFFGLQHDPKTLPSVLVGKPLPAFTAEALQKEGKGLSPETFKGHYTLLNVFASWCGPCHEEHRFLRILGLDGRFAVVGLNWKDSADNAREFLTKDGNPFSAVGFDGNGRIGIDLGVTGPPESFLIDPQGIVLKRYAGPLNPQEWAAEFEPLLRGGKS